MTHIPRLPTRLPHQDLALDALSAADGETALRSEAAVAIAAGVLRTSGSSLAGYQKELQAQLARPDLIEGTNDLIKTARYLE